MRFLALAVAAVLLPAAAEACSCAAVHYEPEELIQDGAVIVRGTVIAGGIREVTYTPSFGEPGAYSGTVRVYRIGVSGAINADPGKTLIVDTAIHGAACGVSLSEGQEVTLVVYPSREGWSINICSQLALGEHKRWDPYFAD